MDWTKTKENTFIIYFLAKCYKVELAKYYIVEFYDSLELIIARDIVYDFNLICELNKHPTVQEFQWGM